LRVWIFWVIELMIRLIIIVGSRSDCIEWVYIFVWYDYIYYEWWWLIVLLVLLFLKFMHVIIIDGQSMIMKGINLKWVKRIYTDATTYASNQTILSFLWYGRKWPTQKVFLMDEWNSNIIIHLFVPCEWYGTNKCMN
jgi:hypothetical protein